MNPAASLAPILLIAFSAAITHAAVIERDWRTPGDGLLTYDTVNKREWLDLPLTRISTFPGGYGGVVSETALGGIFDGFNIAESDDVLSLSESAGIDIGTGDVAVNGASVGFLVDLLGKTAFSGILTIGFLDEFDTSIPSPNQRLAAAIGIPGSGNSAGVGFFSETGGSFDPNALAPIAGVWLYRQVPEPNAGLLTLFAATAALKGHHATRVKPLTASK